MEQTYNVSNHMRLININYNRLASRHKAVKRQQEAKTTFSKVVDVLFEHSEQLPSVNVEGLEDFRETQRLQGLRHDDSDAVRGDGNSEQQRQCRNYVDLVYRGLKRDCCLLLLVFNYLLFVFICFWESLTNRFVSFINTINKYIYQLSYIITKHINSLVDSMRRTTLSLVLR